MISSLSSKAFSSIFLEEDCTGANCAKHVPCFSSQALYNLMHNLGFCLLTHNVHLIKANGQTDIQADWQTGGLADRQTGRHAERWTGGQADRQTGGQADRRTGRKADRQTGRQADRQTGKLAS